MCAMLILPWTLTFSSTPDLAAIYKASSQETLGLVGFFGLCWGFGCVLYGLGVVALGIALGAAVILGITAALGSLVPLLIQHPEEILRRTGLLTVLGVVVMLLGIIVCAVAGKARDRQQGEAKSGATGFLAGLIICVLSGVLSAFLNFGFVFGEEISSNAQSAGNDQVSAVYPLLALLLSAGFIGNAGYSVYLLTKNRTWDRFQLAGVVSHWLLATLMGFLLFGGYVLYGIGIANLGPLGPSAGWSLFLSMFVITANIAGILTGEWRGAGTRARRTMFSGSLILVVAVVILGIANTS
jgi:L-rhamnose-H+ transport protein